MQIKRSEIDIPELLNFDFRKLPGYPPKFYISVHPTSKDIFYISGTPRLCIEQLEEEECSFEILIPGRLWKYSHKVVIVILSWYISSLCMVNSHTLPVCTYMHSLWLMYIGSSVSSEQPTSSSHSQVNYCTCSHKVRLHLLLCRLAQVLKQNQNWLLHSHPFLVIRLDHWWVCCIQI